MFSHKVAKKARGPQILFNNTGYEGEAILPLQVPEGEAESNVTYAGTGRCCVCPQCSPSVEQEDGGHPMLECLSLAALSIQALEDGIGVHVQGRASPLIPSQGGTMMPCPTLT